MGKKSRRQRPATTPATPDASTARYPRASVALRLIALVYDSLLLIALTAVANTIVIAIFTPAGGAESTDFTLLPEWVRYGVQLPITLAVIIGFYGYCWTRSGQTLGMQTWRIELVRRDGLRASWADALRRSLAAASLPVFFGLLANLLQPGHSGVFSLSVLAGFLLNYVWAWFPSRQGSGRCLHDSLSHTEVLKVPAPVREKKRYRFLGLFGDGQ